MRKNSKDCVDSTERFVDESTVAEAQTNKNSTCLFTVSFSREIDNFLDDGNRGVLRCTSAVPFVLLIEHYERKRK